MLIQFNFKNFKSFKEITFLDMTATKTSEHPFHIAGIAKDKVLKIAAIYGANASGKTNIYKAFEFMSKYIIYSFIYGGDKQDKISKYEMVNDYSPFLFDAESMENGSQFEVFFTDNEKEDEKTYQYGFVIKNNQINEEWLYSKAKTSKIYKTVLYRKNDDPLIMPGSMRRVIDNIETLLTPKVLAASLGDILKVHCLSIVRKWFMNNEAIDYNDPFQLYFSRRRIPNYLVENESEQSKVLAFISTFDNSIKGLNIEELIMDSGVDGKKQYTIKTTHCKVGSNEFAQLPLEQESNGTLKMFQLYSILRNVLMTGSVLFIDELGAHLHPLLTRNIILAFANTESNPKNAQLIFTTHDTWHLSKELLRRDEIWFTEKDESGISHLYSLADFVDDNGEKIRKDENYEKNYLLGKYGAIPNLGSLEVLSRSE